MIFYCRGTRRGFFLLLFKGMQPPGFRKDLLCPLQIVFLQQQTYLFFRDLMISRGVSANQIKPVRLIDTEQKKKFFFRLRERY